MFQNELTAAAKRAEKILAERDRIKTALAKTSETVSAAEAEVGLALCKLGTLEADNALIGDEPPADGKIAGAQLADTRAVRKGLTVARENLEAANARMDGLRARLASNRTLLLEAQSALEQARSEAGSDLLAANRTKILAAVDVLRGLMREGLVLDQAFNAVNGSLHLWLKGANFPSENFSVNLLATGPDNGGAPSWLQDARLTALATPEHATVAARLERELSNDEVTDLHIVRPEEQAA